MSKDDLSQSPQKESSFLKTLNQNLPVPVSSDYLGYLAAGGSARLCGAILLSPLDTVKVRLQFQQKYPNKAQLVKTYLGPADAFKTIYKEEGPRAFFKGLGARLMYNVPAAAVSFLFYEQFRALFHNPNPSTKTYLYTILPLLAGGFARVVGTALRTPFDIAKQRMQIQGSLLDTKASGKAYRNSFHALTQVLKYEGMRGLWSGYGATILRDTPFAAIYFVSYEYFKLLQDETYHYFDPNKDLTHTNHFLAGGGAAACAVTLTIPFDVVKTRLQTQGSLQDKRYKGILHCFRTVWAEEGARGLTAGLGPRLLYLCPNAAITFALYEISKQMISNAFFDGKLL